MPRRLFSTTRPLLAAVSLIAALASAESPAPTDPELAPVIAEALAARPELAQAAEELTAAQQRVPQAQALPEPMLQVGVQNDSFTTWNVGKMETSWVQVMAAQTFPFPGKLELKGEIAGRAATQRGLALARLELTTVADVRRAVLGLELAAEQLALLEKLRGQLEKSVGVVQVRYESGEAAQSDLLRARLELARLEPRKRRLQAEARLRLEALNRLRHRPLDHPFELHRRLTERDFPKVPEAQDALARARERSPELLAARAGVEGAARNHALAQKAALPDVSVGAGVMVRGLLEPMWSVTVGVPIPVFAGSKQARGVTEALALRRATEHDVESVEQLLALRVQQRLDAWRSLEAIYDVYQHGLLVQTETTAESTRAQYGVGKVPFSSVLEANVSAISEADAALEVLADAWRLAIAQDELSLDDVTLSPTVMGSPPSSGMTPSPAPRTSGAAGPAGM